MKESNIQTLLKSKNKKIGVFELKLCKGKSIRWDAVKKHQIEALSKAKHETLYHKISDSFIADKKLGRRFPHPKPFDFINVQCPAYIIVCFYIPFKQKKCYYIDIDKYLASWNKSKKKSYREEEARKMATHILDL